LNHASAELRLKITGSVLSARHGVESKGSIKYPQLPDWIEDRADDIPSPLPISEGRMCGSTSLFGDGAIIESAVWRHLSAIKVCESVRSLMDVSNPQRNRTRQ
jgi:hypothetical protein